jgi:hypothetical protein
MITRLLYIVFLTLAILAAMYAMLFALFTPTVSGAIVAGLLLLMLFVPAALRIWRFWGR